MAHVHLFSFSKRGSVFISLLLYIYAGTINNKKQNPALKLIIAGKENQFLKLRQKEPESVREGSLW